MFYRKVLDYLNSWKNRTKRRPLIIRGARQVGKTTAVNMFGSTFENYIYLNLEYKKHLDIFNDSFTFDEILDGIFFFSNMKKDLSDTLIFIDEIQNSPLAIKMMRYFYEKKPELFVITAGSLLETILDMKKISYPVGRVEYLYMYPLTFEEFLGSINDEAALNAYNTIPIPVYSYNRLLEYFNTYAMIGGMPAIVENYINNKDLKELIPLYEGLIKSFIDDAAKYAKNNTMQHIIRHVIETVPYEAGKRIKFNGFGKADYKSREIGEALRALERAMLITLLYPATSTELPVFPNKKRSPRLQFLDTGLINYYTGIHQELLNIEDLASVYRGLIAEHIIGQELQALDLQTSKPITFWVRENPKANSEVDFVLPFNNHLIPLEVKSGKTGTLKSLHQFINKSNVPFAVRFYKGKISIENIITPAGVPYKLFNLPYFLSGKIIDYINYYSKQ